MGTLVVTKYGTVNIEKASQLGPYRLYKKFFKTKEQKIMMDEFALIVKKYYPNYGDKEIEKLYSTLSQSGCTYATMANILMEQLNHNDSIFSDYFGYSLKNSDGSINYNKLMVDIYACISEMVEVEVYSYEKRSFSSLEEAASTIFGNDYTDSVKALNDLNSAGWIGDGIDENDNLIFVNRSLVTNNSFIGKYSDIAKELFNIDNPNITKEQLEGLFKKTGLGYKINNASIYSKFSGLGNIKISNLKKWMNKYFETNGINLTIDAKFIESSNYNYEDFVRIIFEAIQEGYSFDVSAHDNDIWMNNGRDYERPSPENSGHAMNFEGFDNEGNILVCSWGKQYTIAKEFYQKLDFMAIKIDSYDKGIKRGV